MTRAIRIAIVFISVLALVLLVIAAFHPVQHWIAIHSGADYLMCKGSPCSNQIYYNWWSGPGSDLGEATLVAVILTPAIVAYRHHECHNGPCHRLAHHTTAKGYKLCKRCVGRPEADLDLHEIDASHQ